MHQTAVASEAPPGGSVKKARTVTLLGLLTVLVALVGYVREAAIAARFGISGLTDAYFAAIFIPLMIYLILIVGTFSTILIPILLQDGAADDAGKISETFSVITNFVLLTMAVAVGAGMATVKIWMPVLFSGFDSFTLHLAVRLTYIVLPAVMFLGIAGVLTALLNGYHRFSLPASSPAVASIAVITAVVLARGANAIYFIAAASAAGFLFQCLLLIPSVAKLGVRYRFTFSVRHPAIRKLIRLGVPLLLYLALANSTLFVERNLGSHISSGAVATLTYALRLFVVPASFLAAPLATVVYPDFARKAAQGDRGNLRAQTSRVLRMIVFLFVPITVWIMLNALPLTRVLYERGHFGLQDSVLTSRVLMLYSIGVLPNAVAVVLLRCFYAVQDTMTPLFAELIDLVYYLVCAPWLASRFGLSGLAVARGISFFVVAGILVTIALRRHRMVKFETSFVSFTGYACIASFAMALVSWGSWHALQSVFDSGGMPSRIVVLAAVSILSGLSFLGVAALFRMDEAQHIGQTIRTLAFPSQASR